MEKEGGKVTKRVMTMPMEMAERKMVEKRKRGRFR